MPKKLKEEAEQKKTPKVKKESKQKIQKQDEPIDPAPSKEKKEIQTQDTVFDILKKSYFEKNPDETLDGAGGAFFKPDLFDVEFEDQNQYFNIMKNMFTDLNINKNKMSVDEFAENYESLLEMVTEMAVCGCVPAMDYLCFIYKKGVDDVLSVDLTRAHEWGMLATAFGSKLSLERLRMFLDPVYKYVVVNDLVDNIIKNHDIKDDDELVHFVAYSFANLFNEKMGLTLEAMSKKDMFYSEGFQLFLKKASKIRDDVLPLMAKYIA